MITYKFRCRKCAHEWVGERDTEFCSECGTNCTWLGMIQRDHGDTLAPRTQTGYKIAPDLSPQQQAYIERPDVQAKLKSGEYAPIQKGSDEWNHGH